ncbi:MAG: hypothetical protein R3345_14540 [Fulvivirga sp.]|nr:hypothetical protein [Fulvivirga sp.]
MDDVTIFALILLGIGLVMIAYGWLLSHKEKDEEHHQSVDNEGSGNMQERDHNVPQYQSKYTGNQVLNSMQQDQQLRRKIQEEIEKNREQ